jgi:DNA primase
VVCEGYTDVIGFHQAGVTTAVATCGTAFTEDHVRLLKRYASRVVLAFDADKAGQGAAARFYEWEEKHQVEVSVARFPEGQDPGDLASSNPDLLREAVDGSLPFLGFRLQRVLRSRGLDSPEQRSRLANEALAVINEHPNTDVRKLYAGQVASHTGLPAADLVKVAADRRGYVADTPVAPRVAPSENAEFGAVALLLQRWDDIAPWLVESLFSDDVVRRAFLALAEAASDLDKALELADPEAREVLERAAVADLDLDPEIEARNLIRAAVRRELGRRTRVEDPVAIREDIEARQRVDGLDGAQPDPELAEWLLQWLDRRSEERG